MNHDLFLLHLHRNPSGEIVQHIIDRTRHSTAGRSHVTASAKIAGYFIHIHITLGPAANS